MAARSSVVSPLTVSLLYDETGPLAGFIPAGLVAWALGAAAFFAAGSIGGTVPALVVSMGSYVALTRLRHLDDQRGVRS